MTEQGASIAELGLTVNLRAEPWTYPGTFLPFSCLQVGDRLLPLDAPPDPDCGHFVIAIGSNASPDVLRRKFEIRTVSTTIPHLLGRIDGVALGHSAHVSKSGYVAATPYFRASSSTNVVVSVLTDEQLACLDDTEPNYRRITLPSRLLHLSTPAELPPDVYIYDSKRDVVANDASVPLPFGTQATVFRQLADWGILPASLDIADGVPALTRTLGESEELRNTLTKELARRAVRLSWGL